MLSQANAPASSGAGRFAWPTLNGQPTF
jgi:hypothetical protein